jgi:FkbM family methyltransferase
MSFSIKLGNFLYKHAFALYRPLYTSFKNRQDAFEIKLLEQHLRPGDVVLDIGANIGYYALILSRLVGKKGRVHCFEPDKTNFRYLEKATLSHGNIFINNVAAGPKTETIKIYTSKQLNVDHRTYKPEEYDKEIEIEAESMDDYISKKDPAEGGRVDLIKMDIQGFEMQAIQGMQKILKKNTDIKIISEFWPYGLKKAGSSVSAYFKFLSNHGFHCYLLKKDHLEKLSPEKVENLEGLGEKHYFNIFASRSHV